MPLSTSINSLLSGIAYPSKSISLVIAFIKQQYVEPTGFLVCTLYNDQTLNGLTHSSQDAGKCVDALDS